MWCWTLCNSRNVSRGPEGRLLLQQPLQAWLQEQLSNQRSGNTMYCCCQKCLLYVTTVCCVSVSCLLLLQAYIITSYIPTLNKEVLFSLFELIVLVSCLVWSAEESRITKDLWPDVVHHCGDMTAVWMLFLLQADWPQQSAVDRLRCWFDRDLDVGWTGDLLNTEATGVVCSSCRAADV